MEWNVLLNFLQQPTPRKILIDLMIEALDQREKRRAMESVENFKDFPRPTSGREIK